jgi:outer membrane protein OmpA-like peptidoglycan-associated protein
LIAEEKRMYARFAKSVCRVLVLAVVALMPVALVAQVTAKPSVKAPADGNASKWDIFLGYSALIPNARINQHGYNAIDYGAIGSVTRYFNRHAGLQFEVDEHILLPERAGSTTSQPGDDFTGGSVGGVYRFPSGNFTPFVHALFGIEQVGSYYQKDVLGPVLTAGGGLDYNTPLFDHHLSIRLFQGDYQYLHANFGDTDGGSVSFNPQGRISAGLVYGIGTFTPPPPVTLACSLSPASVFPGDPITVTATAGSLNPKLNAIYSWSGSGVTGSGTTASVATGALAAGSYTVKAEVKEGKPGKEGLRPGQIADCSADFTVKAYEPPTVSCVASPSTLNPGDKSTVTATGVSPQNRPLTYSYSVAPGTGSISGSGAMASYDSAGAPTGAVAITCNVTDDKGQSASASASVTITKPYVKPIPHVSALCPISFDNDKARPTRVNNEAKACLDQVTDALKNDPAATVVVVGEANAMEKMPPKGKHAKVKDFASERAVNTKDYLVNEEQSGVDASRISVRTGTEDSQTVQDYLVPAGATFENDVQGTTVVDESAVKTLARKPIGAVEPKKVHKKKAADAKM